jgi:hypothetical protein
MRHFVLDRRQRQLAQVVRALRASARLPGRVDRGQCERHKHGDNGRDHEQLNKRQAAAVRKNTTADSASGAETSISAINEPGHWLDASQGRTEQSHCHCDPR